MECDKTSKEWSLGCLLSTLFNEFNSMQSFDCHGKTFDCRGSTQMKKKQNILSKIIVGQIPNTFGRNSPWVTLCQNYSNYRLKNIAAMGRGQFFLCLYMYTETVKNLLVSKKALSVVVVL